MCKYTAIIVIGIIELYALYLGMNGIALSLTIGAVAGLGGFEVGRIYKKVKTIKEEEVTST